MKPYRDEKIDDKDIEFQLSFKNNLERLRERKELRKKYNQPIEGYSDHNDAGRNFWGIKSKEEKEAYTASVIHLAKNNRMLGRWYSWYKDWLLINIDGYLEIPPKAYIMYSKNKETGEYEPFLRIYRETSIDKGFNQKLIRSIANDLKYERPPKRNKKIRIEENIRLQKANDLREKTKNYIKKQKKKQSSLSLSYVKNNIKKLFGENPLSTYKDISKKVFKPKVKKETIKPSSIEDLLKIAGNEKKEALDSKKASNRIKTRIKRLKLQ